MPYNFNNPVAVKPVAAKMEVYKHTICKRENRLEIVCRYYQADGTPVTDEQGEIVERGAVVELFAADGTLLHGIPIAHLGQHKALLYAIAASNSSLTMGETGTVS